MYINEITKKISSLNRLYKTLYKIDEIVRKIEFFLHNKDKIMSLMIRKKLHKGDYTQMNIIKWPM